MNIIAWHGTKVTGWLLCRNAYAYIELSVDKLLEKPVETQYIYHE